MKAPKALLISTGEAAGLKRWLERPTAKELKMIKELAVVTAEKEDQAFLPSAEPAPERAPSLRRAWLFARACAEPDSSPELAPAPEPAPSLRRA